MFRARLYNSRIPSYPVIKGGTWPKEPIRRLIAAADDLGHDGIVFQGTDALVDYDMS